MPSSTDLSDWSEGYCQKLGEFIQTPSETFGAPAEWRKLFPVGDRFPNHRVPLTPLLIQTFNLSDFLLLAELMVFP